MAGSPDLTERLTTAATAVIRAERASIERQGPAKIRSLTLELDVGHDGQLAECRAYIERRVPFRKVANWRPDA